jgi:uncharacterized delta-60 repeat protein
MLKRSILISLLLVALAAPAGAAAGAKVQVDRSFGSAGTVEARFGPVYSRTTFVSIFPQPDGSMLATRAYGRGGSGGQLRRYTATGALDPGFSPKEGGQTPEALDAEGKIVRSFTATPVGSLERLNPDGTRDPTFGVEPETDPWRSDDTGFRIEAIKPLATGEILVGGRVTAFEAATPHSHSRTYFEQVALARFDHEGRLDPSFGNGGIVKLKSDVGLGGERVTALAPRPGGGLVAVVLDSMPPEYGETLSPTGSTLVGLGPDGRLDDSYGSAGTIRVPDASLLHADALPGGELLVAGNRWGPQLPSLDVYASDVVANRYTADGAPDADFGAGDGSVVVDLSGIDLLGAALRGGDGSIWLGGSASELDSANCRRYRRFCPETPFLIRLASDGTPFPGFGSGGVLRFDSLSYPFGQSFGGVGVRALAARPGGGVLAAGGSSTVAFIAAFTAGGALDGGFGSGGISMEAEPGPSDAIGRAAAVDSRGRILVSGETNAGLVDSWGWGTLFRYLPNGQLDRSFSGGFVRTIGNGRAVVVGDHDAAFVLSGREPAVTKIDASGRTVSSFGEEGTVDLGSAPVAYRGRNGHRRRPSLQPRAIAALPGGGLLVAGLTWVGDARLFVLRLRADGSPDPSFADDGFTLVGCGRRLGCAVKQIAVQRDGRLVIAGWVEPRGKIEAERLALIRLRLDGARDRGFGHGGVAAMRVGKRSYASALAIEGNGRIVVAGRALWSHRKEAELLLRYTPSGRLDRGFGRGGKIDSPLARTGAGFAAGPRQLLLQGPRILVLRDRQEKHLVVYRRDGRGRHAFFVARRGRPGIRLRAPFAALQEGRLLLGWTYNPNPLFSLKAFKLQRLRLRGLPG